MGVEGLWKYLTHGSEERSFLELGLHEKELECRRSEGCLTVGVDASLLFHQAAQVFHNTNHINTGQNPELRTLVYQLGRLASYPGIVCVYVFDGPGRPSTKRGVKVVSRPLWMVARMKELIEAFGFYHHQAPGEADAELAEMNKRGLVDVIFSDDVDCFIFGARSVIRRCGVDKEMDNVIVYLARKFGATPGPGLTHADLKFMALLKGGDYDQTGVKGIGLDTAAGLARAGFGNELVSTAEELGRSTKFYETLIGFRNRVVEELATNSSGCLRRSWPTLAKKIPVDFPYIYALELYLWPLTSWSDGQSGIGFTDWVPRSPNVRQLALLFERNFSWYSDGIIDKRMLSIAWPAYFVRSRFSGLEIPIESISKTRAGPTHAPATTFYRITVKPTYFFNDINSANFSSRVEIPSELSKLWVPSQVLEQLYPTMVALFRSGQKGKGSTRVKTYSPVLTSKEAIVQGTVDSDSDLSVQIVGVKDTDVGKKRSRSWVDEFLDIEDGEDRKMPKLEGSSYGFEAIIDLTEE